MSSPHCIANPPKLCSSYGAGKVQQLGGLNCYVSGPSHSKLAVLLVSDVFDKVGDAGFYVVVPDFFHGDPYVENGAKPIGVWLKDHVADNVCKDAKVVIEDLKAGGVTKVGIGGVCSGGKAAVDLAKIPCVEATVLLHPAFVTLDDIQDVKVPISILGAENDETIPAKVVKQFEIALQAKPEVDSLVKIFAGVTHGWTVRYDEDDKVAVKAAEEAHQDLLKCALIKNRTWELVPNVRHKVIGCKWVLRDKWYVDGTAGSFSSQGFFTRSKYIADILARDNMDNTKCVSTSMSSATSLAIHDGEPVVDATDFCMLVGLLPVVDATDFCMLVGLL
nr:endo-1,3;1,4-beta-D-glucanase-like isoform X1 [Ipomoea batatas]